MPIRILPSILSSQISAGEIIERPASVVKEIIENSIDANSKNIDIVIEKSGFQSISIKDDGYGIHKNELFLAITHHATSKINSLSDLDLITSFGFRGEALASIRAVSRLTLISSTKLNNIAWKIYSEGLINNIIFHPIAHPQGTTVTVENLFYNIPVRLKFIKNKKLEFVKIFDIIKKIALSHFNINFSIKHNGKLIARYNSINNKKDKIYRLNDILKRVNINQLLEIKENQDDLFLSGWISYPQIFQDVKKIQYCYINNRYVHNNILISAICSAYNQILGHKNISFILYLKIPPDKIDINIHPTKNEIKFHSSNVIYTFVYKTILYNLMRLQKKYFPNNSSFITQKNIYKKRELNNFNFINFYLLTLLNLFFFKKNVFFKENYIIKNKNFTSSNIIFSNKNNFSIRKLLIIIHNYYGLIFYNDNFSLISFPLAKALVQKQKLINNIVKEIAPKCFSTHIVINVTIQEYKTLFYNKNNLLKIGLHLIFKKKYVILSSAPSFLKKKDIDLIILNFFSYLFLKKTILISDILNWFYENVFIELNSWNYTDGIAVLLEMEYYCSSFLINPPPKLLQKININEALSILKI